MGRCHVLSAILLALSVLLGARAAAEDAPSSELKQNATAHFERGVELYSEGNLDAALVEFERAYELVPNYRLLFNLAQIQADRHDSAAALGLFQRYLDAGGEEIPEERRAQTESEMQKLRTRIAQLWVSSNVDGARLFVNELAIASLPLTEALTINSGVLELRVEAPGYQPRTKRVKVAGGESPRVTLNLTAAAAPSAVAVGAVREPKATDYTALSISSASFVVLGGAALGFGLASSAASSSLDEALDRFPADKGEVDTARSRLKLYSALTVGCAAGSLVALGVAVYFLIDPPKLESQRAARPEPRAKLQLFPTLHGVSVQGAF